jgi:hypothetical protein
LGATGTKSTGAEAGALAVGMDDRVRTTGAPLDRTTPAMAVAPPPPNIIIMTAGMGTAGAGSAIGGAAPTATALCSAAGAGERPVDSVRVAPAEEDSGGVDKGLGESVRPDRPVSVGEGTGDGVCGGVCSCRWPPTSACISAALGGGDGGISDGGSGASGGAVSGGDGGRERGRDTAATAAAVAIVANCGGATGGEGTGPPAGLWRSREDRAAAAANARTLDAPVAMAALTTPAVPLPAAGREATGAMGGVRGREEEAERPFSKSLITATAAATSAA